MKQKIVTLKQKVFTNANQFPYQWDEINNVIPSGWHVAQMHTCHSVDDSSTLLLTLLLQED